MPRAITKNAITPLSRFYHPRRRKPVSIHAYMAPVTDDGYPPHEPEPEARPRANWERPAVAPPVADRPAWREARIRWHTLRVARRE